MKFVVVTLFLAAYAQAKSVEEPLQTSAYNYLAKSVEYTNQRRLAEERNAADQRVIGGQAAQLGQFPYQAGLQITILNVGTASCGGSLVSPTKVITAAHCYFDGVNRGSSILVRLGTLALFGSSGLSVPATRVVLHPNWFPWLVRNDVGMLTIPRVTTSNTIAPISLPTGPEVSEHFAGLTATVSGYGLTSEHGTPTAAQMTLNFNNLQVMTNAACSPNFVPLLVHPSNICTSGAGIVGACRGDSGGPLAMPRNGRNVLIGVVSFGAPEAQGGCEGGRPSVYARVTNYLSWFLHEMEIN